MLGGHIVDGAQLQDQIFSLCPSAFDLIGLEDKGQRAEIIDEFAVDGLVKFIDPSVLVRNVVDAAMLTIGFGSEFRRILLATLAVFPVQQLVDVGLKIF